MLGSLEDLFISDLIQIIFLSRRTGILEITDKRGRSRLIFSQGLIVNASSPNDPQLATELRNAYLGEDALPFLSMKQQQGIPVGSAVLELGLMTREELQNVILDRLRRVVTPILALREGQFNFSLAEAIAPGDAEYDPMYVFGEAGISLQRITETEGQKLKPLRGLEHTMRAVAASRATGSTPSPVTPSPPLPVSPSIERGGEGERGREGDEAPEAPTRSMQLPVTPSPPHPLSPSLETGETDSGRGDEPEAPFDLDRDPTPRFRVGSASSEVAQRSEPLERRVIVVEADPMVRVAVRRRFGKQGVAIQQFGGTREALKPIEELVQKNQFFVTILDATPPVENALAVLQYVKRANRRLPVLICLGDAEQQSRRTLADGGADVFIKKPGEEELKTPAAQGELDRFCNELVDLAEKAYESWEQLSVSLGQAEERGARFYEMSQHEKMGQGFGLLKQLINELTEPGDVGQIADTILRLSAEYLDRAVLFAADADAFVGLGAVGMEHVPHMREHVPHMREHVQHMRVPRNQPSVLREVAESRKPHRGKLRREPANEYLINSLGKSLPTEAVVLPVLNDEEVVGLLYGDNAANRSPIGNISGLEIFLSQAGFALQNALAAIPSEARDLGGGTEQ